MILGVRIQRATPLAPGQLDSEASGLWKDILLEMRVGDWFEVPLQRSVAIYRAAWRLHMKIETQKGATSLRVTRVA